jgi:hypothetical protein
MISKTDCMGTCAECGLDMPYEEDFVGYDEPCHYKCAEYYRAQARAERREYEMDEAADYKERM